jgi:hypothetical protein
MSWEIATCVMIAGRILVPLSHGRSGYAISRGQDSHMTKFALGENFLNLRSRGG